jgi:iron(III) transport system permease protein
VTVPGATRSPVPLVTGGLVAAFSLVPLMYVVDATLAMDSGELRRLLLRDRVTELLGNTAALLVGTVALTLVIGVVAALVVVRTDLPWKPLWHAVLAAPLAVPAFVNSYGWVSLTHAVQSYAGAVLVVSLSYYPLVYLPVVGALAGLDAGPEEVAMSLGRSRLRTLLTVVLPRLLPAVLGGALLVALHVLAEFGALQMLAYQTFTTAIYGQYRSAFASEGGTVLAGVLVACCLLLLVVEMMLRGRRRLSRSGRGTGRPAEPVGLGRARVPLLAALVGFAAVSLGVPLAALTRWTVVGSSTEFPLEELGRALGSTLGLAAAGAALTTVLALAPAWLAVRTRGPVGLFLERCTYVANAMPGIVVALALVYFSIRLVPDWYQTVPVLVAAYAMLFLPRAVVSVRGSLESSPPVLEEVSRSLGQSGWATLRRVTLPLVSPGLGAAIALCFLAVSTELTATLILAPTGTRTLATEFWSHSSAVQYGAAAPYAILLILVSVPATVLLARQVRPRSSA